VQIPHELPVTILKQAAHYFLERNNELFEERAPLCDNNWQLDLKTLVGLLTISITWIWSCRV